MIPTNVFYNFYGQILLARIFHFEIPKTYYCFYIFRTKIRWKMLLRTFKGPPCRAPFFDSLHGRVILARARPPRADFPHFTQIHPANF